MSLVRARQKMRYMMPLVWAFVAVFVLGAVFMYTSPGTRSGTGASTSTRFARINGEEITPLRWEQEVSSARRIYEQQTRFFGMPGQPITLDQQGQLPSYAYEQLLQEFAEAEAAKRAGVNVSAAEASAAAEKRVEEELRQVGQGATPDELAQIRSRRLALIDVASERRRLAAQKLREKLTREARPVEVRVAHILIKPDKRGEDAALRLAQEVTRRARSGEDFTNLVSRYSEDDGSKIKGGEVGWVSAQPASPPSDPKAKPDPNAPGSFVPEFTAGALRLRVGEVSNPIRSDLGYHVIRCLQERPYTPKNEKDPKKREEAIDRYKTDFGNRVAEGLIAEARHSLKVEAFSPWLRGYLAEQEARNAAPPTAPGAKAPTDESARLQPAIQSYEEALAANGPEVDAGLAYKLGRLYERAKADDKALAIYEKWEKRGGAEIYYAKGEVLERLKRKTDALAAYQDALKYAYDNSSLLGRVADRFKALGRKDLEEQARKEQAKLLTRQAAMEKERQAQFERMVKEREAEEAGGKAAEKPASGGQPASGGAAALEGGFAPVPSSGDAGKSAPDDAKKSSR